MKAAVTRIRCAFFFFCCCCRSADEVLLAICPTTALSRRTNLMRQLLTCLPEGVSTRLHPSPPV